MCHRVSSAAATPTPGRAWVSALVVSETASEFRVVSWCWVIRLMEGIDLCLYSLGSAGFRPSAVWIQSRTQDLECQANEMTMRS